MLKHIIYNVYMYTFLDVNTLYIIIFSMCSAITMLVQQLLYAAS